jgi:hypothetical protein
MATVGAANAPATAIASSFFFMKETPGYVERLLLYKSAAIVAVLFH